MKELLKLLSALNKYFEEFLIFSLSKTTICTTKFSFTFSNQFCKNSNPTFLLIIQILASNSRCRSLIIHTFDKDLIKIDTFSTDYSIAIS